MGCCAWREPGPPCSLQVSPGTWLQLQDGAWIYAPLVAPQPTGLPVVEGAPAPVPVSVPAAAPRVGVQDMPGSEELRLHHLAHINALRTRAAKPAVGLGPPGVAQQHALELAAGDYIAHWDRQGLAPYIGRLSCEGIRPHRTTRVRRRTRQGTSARRPTWGYTGAAPAGGSLDAAARSV